MDPGLEKTVGHIQLPKDCSSSIIRKNIINLGKREMVTYGILIQFTVVIYSVWGNVVFWNTEGWGSEFRGG
jgi:hypothetical protein